MSGPSRRCHDGNPGTLQFWRCLIASGFVIVFISLPLPASTQNGASKTILPCSNYKMTQDWVFALLPQGSGMREYSNAVLRAMRKLQADRPIMPSGRRALPLRNQFCTIEGKVGLAIWNFLDQKEQKVAIQEINDRSLKVILPNGKVIDPDSDGTNRCPPRRRC